MRPQQWQCYCCQQFWYGVAALQDTCVLQPAWLVLDSSRNLCHRPDASVRFSGHSVAFKESHHLDVISSSSAEAILSVQNVISTHMYIYSAFFVTPGLWNRTLKCSYCRMTGEHVLTHNISFPFPLGLEHFHFWLIHDSLLLIDWCVVRGVKMTAPQVSRYWVHISKYFSCLNLIDSSTVCVWF